ncbi:MAG: DUF3883 domain-containing protein [Endozoicomonas sp.]|uniref:DUF3883 domain-containing protein n=1 Tax=Endozoicomonas sp. TaxID=1892382 RepID=UPI003D9B31C0
MSTDWKSEELSLIVADYFAMLTSELSGKKYNKAHHRRVLFAQLPLRTDGAIEFKHCNISAVLHQLNLPSISGYKPRNNFQNSLVDAVSQWLEANSTFIGVVESDVQKNVSLPENIDYQSIVVPPPTIEVPKQAMAFDRKVTRVSTVNWLAREASNQSLGLAGESIVLEYEEQRLRQSGHKKLADKIEHTSRVVGDGTGYDILSYELSGKPRHIEVKTTRYGKETPFWLSANELGFSIDNSDSYFLYRLYNFRKGPRLFMLQGAVNRHCQLKPQQYMAAF